MELACMLYVKITVIIDLLLQQKIKKNIPADFIYRICSMFS